MKVAVITLVLLGVVAAACAAVLIAALTSRGNGAPTAAINNGEPMVEVLLAAHDLPPMSVIDSAAVTTKKIPKSQVPQNALLNSVQVVGKVITDRMVSQQIFTKNAFAREGSGVYLAAAVPPGKRAMSITLNDWSGMAGLLYPGSVVDVLVSFKTLGEQGSAQETEMSATTLLQGLQVLAIGSQSIAEEEYKDRESGALAARGQMNFRMVTLLVDPKQAEILQLAMLNGSISLSMRNPLDGKQDARRLTRAREIAPGRQLAPVSTAAAPNPDPFDDTVIAPTTQPSANAGDGMWETLIIRGNVSEKRSFSLPPEKAQQGKTVTPSEPSAANSTRS